MLGNSSNKGWLRIDLSFGCQFLSGQEFQSALSLQHYCHRPTSCRLTGSFVGAVCLHAESGWQASLCHKERNKARSLTLRTDQVDNNGWFWSSAPLWPVKYNYAELKCRWNFVNKDLFLWCDLHIYSKNKPKQNIKIQSCSNVQWWLILNGN